MEMRVRILQSWFEDGNGSDGGEDDIKKKEKGNNGILDQYSPIFSLVQACFCSMYQIVVLNMVGTVIFSYVVADFSIVDSVYLSTVTSSTVGYGDLKPQSQLCRAFTCFFAIFGTMVFARAVGDFGGAVAEYNLNAKSEALLAASNLDLETYRLADKDGSQQVTRAEFIILRLKQLELVPDELLDKIEQQFDMMDKNKDDALTVQDIVQAQSVQRSRMQSLRKGSVTAGISNVDIEA
ncbi:hypothetical protein CYMTET_37838 [Cymbomonas tetramitiformis]|uniref:EF-hand domain-containing protein n=1 Tax=Cymbomonas tetramitiformis TaxID=36881 RepID=A0AAE0F684_9CHLO|nr:hypothetical protein CYMTET_37838 [Cymbomonas tetramitiformis]